MLTQLNSLKLGLNNSSLNVLSWGLNWLILGSLVFFQSSSTSSGFFPLLFAMWMKLSAYAQSFGPLVMLLSWVSTSKQEKVASWTSVGPTSSSPRNDDPTRQRLFEIVCFAVEILQSMANAIAVLMFAVGSAAWRVSHAARWFGLGDETGQPQEQTAHQDQIVEFIMQTFAKADANFDDHRLAQHNINYNNN